jgi:hypothetical protein
MKITGTGVKNFAGAVGRVADRALRNEVLLVDTSTKKKRLSVCNECEYRSGMQCSVCECFLLAKTMLASESCPKEKW